MTWWQRLFRLAGVRFAAHIAPPGDVPVKEDTVAGKDDAVARVMASAEGGAEAMLDCGIDVDDTELVANFINSMAEIRQYMEDHMRPTWERCVKEHGEAEVHDFATSMANIMQSSPAFTSPWFLWRLSKAVANMASPDVLEAAREAVHASTRPTDGNLFPALAKLAATLPKERGQ